MRNETNAIQWQLNEQSTILKTLETRFASPRLLETALYDIHKRYFNMSQHLSKTFVPEDGETPLFKWLTQADKNYPFEWKDIQTIRQLLAWNIPEIKAKNGLAIAYQRNLYPNANTLSYFLKSFVETVAAEMLVHSSVNQIVEECNRSKRNKNSRKFAKVFITEESEAEIDQLKFKNDEEENRMIDDSNVLEDGFQVHTNKVKEVKRDNWFNKEILKNYFDLITFALPLTEEEANEIEDIWVLPLQRRWKLYQYWIKKCREEVKEKIKTLEKEYSKKMKMLSELRSLSDVDVLKSAKIVGMTTTGAAQHQSALRALRPRIVIVEEAAEVLEAHLITALTHACQHLILIGDHKQLRPSPAEYELAKKYNLEVSLFERLIKNGYPYRMLKNQHRMCTDISRVLMPHFYEDLLDDPSVLEKESVRGVTKNLLFINHSYPELTEKEFRSHKNEYEANFAIQLANYFLQQSYKAEQITILCTYLDQLLELRKMAYNKFGNDHGFVIQSVDNYQGEENDIVILSLVRSDNPENKIGFLKVNIFVVDDNIISVFPIPFFSDFDSIDLKQ
uniref:Uncharacterized protein n=1 Tax=Panagrolaimus superbus TaxID=310955 RepID=A0A914YAC6_9BILA